jgi:hypothetical protein
MSGTVKITGVDEVIAKLEAKFSKGRVSRIENNALRIAGRLMAVRLKQAVASYRDTGKTVIEITTGSARTRGGVKSISIGWSGSGSGQRWRLVHLNEFGYTRWGRSYSPRGMGQIQGAFDSSKDAVKQLERYELERLL